jgi:hypothetical protein
MATSLKSMSINGFDLEYSVPDLKITAKYLGNLLSDIIKLPTYKVNHYDPLNSIFYYDSEILQLADKVFDTMEILYINGEHCVAALFASHFYELLGKLNVNFILSGNHVLSVPFWLSVINLVRAWEGKHPGISIHIGTPLYFLSEAYLMMQNNDLAFAYLIKSIEDDNELSHHCPMLNYPKDEPAYRTACLIDNPYNHMYTFIVQPLRSEIENAIKKYNKLFGINSRLASIIDFDSKFLQKENTTRIRIEHIKYLFVLELIKLLQLRNIRIDSRFLPTLLLNRLFGLSLVVDKLLYARYPPKPPKKKERGKDPNMWTCVISYGNSHYITQKDLENLKLKTHSPEKALVMLLQRRSQKKFKVIPREMYPILISYIIRNTSAHKIQSVAMLSSQFDKILQSLMEAIFIIVG